MAFRPAPRRFGKQTRGARQDGLGKSMDGCDKGTTVVIEPACETDLPEIMAVLETANMHHIPSLEMPTFDLACAFVARLDRRVVGVAGYKVLSATEAKTTLLAVLPGARRHGIGRKLQERRMDVLAARGVRTLTTNADRPETIAWYENHFGYAKVGTLPKLHSFGLAEVGEWTTLETDLAHWRRKS
jgi:GNAT superfamily N-acetyltransferase